MHVPVIFIQSASENYYTSVIVIKAAGSLQEVNVVVEDAAT